MTIQSRPVLNSSRLAGLSRWGARHHFLYFTLPLAAWATFIAWASLAPSSQLPGFDLPHGDKVGHTLCYAILGVLMLRGWARQTRPRLLSCAVVMISGSAWGFYLEVLQKLSGYRTFEWLDLTCDAIGILSGVIFWVMITRSQPAGAAISPDTPQLIPIEQESEAKSE